jgi:hypothetical protein
MNVSVEFNQIAPDSGRRSRISVLHDVELGAAIPISAALRGNTEVEAVIVVGGPAARPPSGLLAGLLAKPWLPGWLHGGQARLAPDWAV